MTSAQIANQRHRKPKIFYSKQYLELINNDKDSDIDFDYKNPKGIYRSNCQQYWDYDKPCEYCGRIWLCSHLKSQRKLCCQNGKLILYFHFIIYYLVSLYILFNRRICWR